jgi:hypothetical protein
MRMLVTGCILLNILDACIVHAQIAQSFHCPILLCGIPTFQYDSVTRSGTILAPPFATMQLQQTAALSLA